jgi:uncharacterized RDD family membrane protein YckC
MATPSQAPVPQFNLGGYAQQPSLPGVPFWPRVAARLIDTFVHLCFAFGTGLIIGVAIAVVATAKGANVQAEIAKMQGNSITAFILALVGGIAYQAICEGLHGSTLGKLMLGQVVLDTDKRPCGLRAAVIRSSAYLIDSLFFGAVGYFEMQKTDLHQRHGDNWAHTFVCKRSEAPPEALRGAGRFIAVLVVAGTVDMAFLALGTLLKFF